MGVKFKGGYSRKHGIQLPRRSLVTVFAQFKSFGLMDGAGTLLSISNGQGISHVICDGTRMLPLEITLQPDQTLV